MRLDNLAHEGHNVMYTLELPDAPAVQWAATPMTDDPVGVVEMAHYIWRATKMKVFVYASCYRRLAILADGTFEVATDLTDGEEEADSISIHALFKAAVIAAGPSKLVLVQRGWRPGDLAARCGELDRQWGTPTANRVKVRTIGGAS